MVNLELDHFGVIVKSIKKDLSLYRTLGYDVDGDVFEDTNQQMRGVFLKAHNDSSYRLELIEDLSESRALSRILSSQCGRIYHMAFKVLDLESSINEIMRQLNAIVLSPIKSATYFGKVCFLFLPNAQIIELVEYR